MISAVEGVKPMVKSLLKGLFIYCEISFILLKKGRKFTTNLIDWITNKEHICMFAVTWMSGCLDGWKSG